MLPTHDEVMAATTEHHELQRWRAARTVRLHVSAEQGQDDLLECLGLQDVVPPRTASA